MPHDKNRPIDLPRDARITLRIARKYKDLISQAAEREGLQLSSFTLLCFVRLKHLPELCLKSLKRRPVNSFDDLHSLLGVVNKIGGNCKQLGKGLPDNAGLETTHFQIVQAAAAITDALHGKSIPTSVNLYRLQGQITSIGHTFNRIVKSVNIGKPDLAGLPATLIAITEAANAITAALNDKPVESEDELLERAMEEMRTNMYKRDNA